MKLYVVRHGQTEWNYENRVCGVSDVQLTDKGKEQANELSKIINKKQIDIILTSPLSRAVKTAEILSSGISKDLIIDHRLIEQDYGVFEGDYRDNNNFSEAKRDISCKLSGGESILQVAQRIFNLLDEDFQEELAMFGFDKVYICPHQPGEGCVCRKPLSGMLIKAAQDNGLELKNCVVIGDRWIDMIAAKRAGCKKVLVKTGSGEKGLAKYRNNQFFGEWLEAAPDYIAEDLLDAVNWLLEHKIHNDDC